MCRREEKRRVAKDGKGRSRKARSEKRKSKVLFSPCTVESIYPVAKMKQQQEEQKRGHVEEGQIKPVVLDEAERVQKMTTADKVCSAEQEQEEERGGEGQRASNRNTSTWRKN